MKSRVPGHLLILFAAALAIGAAILFFSSSRPSGSRDAQKPEPSASPDRSTGETAPSTANLSPTSSERSVTPASPLLVQIEALFAKLAGRPATRAELDALEQALASDPRQAIAAITQFLRSGRDARTGMAFSVGEAGRLTGAPTLRVFLLDLLGALSRQLHSPEAAGISRSILESKTSPDEWAVAMRNVAWQEPGAARFLSAKFREMATDDLWRQSATPGFFEAFDVAVFTRDPSLIPVLEEPVRSNIPSLQRAAAIALDRLAERAPLEVMSYLNGNPGTMAERPFLRADYFAKANLAEVAQRQAIEQYLSRADVTAAEKTKLLRALAAPASFVSETLLTAPLPEPDDAARAAAIASATSDWLAQRRFPELASEISALRKTVTAP